MTPLERQVRKLLSDCIRRQRNGHLTYEMSSLTKRLQSFDIGYPIHKPKDVPTLASALQAMLDHYGPPNSVAALCDYPPDHPITMARNALGKGSQ